MIYYFSAPNYIPNLLEMGVKTFLFSYGNNTTLSAVKRFKDMPDVSIMIDSGAFSLWNSGVTIDINKYLDACLQVKKSDYIYVSLDVIPTTNSSKIEIQKCADKGFENYLFLKQHLPNVLPVFHYGEHFDNLKRYMEYTDYIGISPANDTSPTIKEQYIKKCMYYTGITIKTHAFGFSNLRVLRKYPVYSCDSISYKFFRLKQQDKSKTTNVRVAKKYMILYKQKVASMQQEVNFITELWKKRGVTWNN